MLSTVLLILVFLFDCMEMANNFILIQDGGTANENLFHLPPLHHYQLYKTLCEDDYILGPITFYELLSIYDFK